MFFKTSINFINEFFFFFSKQIREFYLNSSIYNKKISKFEDNTLIYKPNLSILSSLVNYEKKKRIKLRIFMLTQFGKIKKYQIKIIKNSIAFIGYSL